MYPVLFRLGSFEITSFGVMVALGAALGILLLRRELVRSGLDGAKGVDAALVGVLGGLAGAKLLYVAEHWAEPISSTLLSRGGMSWYGGLTGGVLAGLAMMAWQRLPADAGPVGRGAGHDARPRGRANRLLPRRRRLREADVAAVGRGVPGRAAADHRPGASDAALRGAALFALTVVLALAARRGAGTGRSSEPTCWRPAALRF